MRSILIADILLLFFAVYIKHSYQLSYPCNSSAECGCSTNTATVTRIVGGEVAGTSTWGWAVSIKIGIYDGLCGGAIIASQWILTAAHCLSSVTASQITVYAGSDTMWSGQVRTVSVMYIHPNYSSSTYRNDIALLQLSSALNMTDLNVKIVCIPSVSSSVLSAGEWPPANVDVVAVGWGTTSSGGYVSNSLRQVTMSTIAANASMCSSVIYDSALQFCAGITCGGRDTCQGDSGGPLMMYTTSGQWLIIGVTSYGVGCALPSYAGVYTRIAYYQSWISSTMSGGAPINPTSSDYTISTLISGCTTQGGDGSVTTTSTSTTSTLTTVRTTPGGSILVSHASRYVIQSYLVFILITVSVSYHI